jgi:hypothetical protein
LSIAIDLPAGTEMMDRSIPPSDSVFRLVRLVLIDGVGHFASDALTILGMDERKKVVVSSRKSFGSEPK